MEKMVNNMIDLSFYKGKRVLVTGHTGFKGAWLSIWLNKIGAEVLGYSLDNKIENSVFEISDIGKKIIDIRGDIRDYDKLKKSVLDFKPEIVFHLAAQPLVIESYQSPRETIEVNVQGTCNLLEVIRFCDSVRSIVMITTDKCYENQEWVWSYRETDQLGGHDPYSSSKAASELIISSYYRSFFKRKKQIGVASMRAGNVIGGGDWSENRIVPDIFRSILKDNPVVVRNPQSIRPWQHVLDPLGFYLFIAQKIWNNPNKYSGPWNIGPNSNNIKTVQNLVDEIINFCGFGSCEVDISEVKNHESNSLSLDINKSIHILGWKPVLNFKETVKLTCEWYLSDANIDYLELAYKQINHYTQLCISSNTK